MYQELFFILGCQRSGTTLTRLILDSHDEIHCFDEYKSYMVLAREELLKQQLKNYKDKKLIGFKTPAYTEQMNSSSLVEFVNNTKITNRFRDEKIIFLYRDVRDVVSSMRNYVQKDGIRWMDKWIIPTINKWKEIFPDFTTKYEKEISIIENSDNKLLLYAALYWKVKTSAVMDYELENKPLIKIKYENLVNDPDKEIRKMINFLGILWDQKLLQHHLNSHDEVDSTGYTVGHNNPRRPIDADSVGQYRKNLSINEQQEILCITNDVMEKLGYHLQ